MTSSKIKVLCIMGPTASGKTKLACDIYDRHPSEIISVDSVLVYKGLDIGSAKPTKAELDAYPHALVDIVDPAESYCAGDFCRDATKLIRSAAAKGKLPILVGGTCLYFQALQRGLDPLPEVMPEVALELNLLFSIQGLDYLYKRLQVIDPVYASKINKNDKQRIMRSLGVCLSTGNSFSSYHSNSFRGDEFSFHNVILLPNRDILRAKVRTRIEQMFELGFIKEVRSLYARSDLSLDKNSIRVVGYKQVWQYLDGDIKQDELLDKIYFATCQLAKRQFTWLKKFTGLCFYDENYDSRLKGTLHLVAKMLL